MASADKKEDAPAVKPAGGPRIQDYSAEVEAALATHKAIIASTLVNGEISPDVLRSSLPELLEWEKKARLAADTDSTVKMVVYILHLLKDAKNWESLNEHILLLSKRRAQLTKAMTIIVTEAIQFIPLTPNLEVKEALIQTLRTVSEGKMFAELERARLTKDLAKMKEDGGDINKASEILQEISVEIVGTMELAEKAEFLLEQIRLCLLQRDFVRAEIISKKVKPSSLNEAGMEALKVRFHTLIIQLEMHKSNFLAVCKSNKEILDTKTTQASPELFREALTNTVLFLCLSPYNNDVSDLYHRISATYAKQLDQLPAVKLLVKRFTTTELIQWPLPDESAWREHSAFKSAGVDVEMAPAASSSTKSAPDATADDLAKFAVRWDTLHKRVVQHNIRTIARHYSRIRLARIASLLGLDSDRAEEFVSEVVQEKQLYAKIDRPGGIVNFEKPQSPPELLNALGADLSALLGLVDKTCHMVSKENIMHGIKTKA